MHRRTFVLALVTVGVLAGCTRATMFGHTAKDEPAAGASGAGIATTSAALAPITRIAVEFTPAARQQTEDDARFNSEWLREAIIAELRSRQLLNLQPSGAGGPALVVRLEEFEVRAASNIVIFGRLASTGVLDALARVTAKAGDAREFRVRAEVSLHIARNGDEKNPLKTLYSGFAERLVDALVGKQSPRETDQTRQR
jgi:hypothetical protein